MRRTFQAVLLLLIGGGILRISLFSDIAQRYVKPGLQPYLITSGAVLVLLGVVGALRDGSRRRNGTADTEVEPDDGIDTEADASRGGGTHGHDHTRGPRAAWLLLPPALLLIFFAPPALGSYSAAHDNPLLVGPWGHFAALPATDPVPLSLTEYIGRVQQDKKQSLVGRTVFLEGFVAPGDKGSWNVSRLIVWCCAADAQSLSVTVHGVKAPPVEAWVQVTGTWHPVGTFGTASAALALDATSVRRIPEPERPYQDKTPSLPARPAVAPTPETTPSGAATSSGGTHDTARTPSTQ